jgi:nicotinate-nucleotide--dimethylbenzimidazole phosphoribosyltransferase
VEQLRQTLNHIRPLDRSLTARVQARLDNLTKPHGSLGRLEELALRCALITGRERPRVDKKVLFICCADHGVCDEGVSAYPREVTAQMVYNFLRGGAAITVLGRQLGINVQVVDLGVDHDFDPHLLGLVQKKIGRGTANFARGPAMSTAAAVQAIETGIMLARDAVRDGAQLLGIGEMGIGNTTAATALLSALGDFPPEELVGLGTGIDEATRQRKIAVIYKALARNFLDLLIRLDVWRALADMKLRVWLASVSLAPRCVSQ